MVYPTGQIPLHAYPLSALPRGVSIGADIKRYLPNFQARVVFDVGANIGKLAQQFIHRFPGSQIYCFEPVNATFDILQRNLKAFSFVHCFNMALGGSLGSGTMLLQGACDMFRLADPAIDLTQYPREKQQSVIIETVDDFCKRQGIARISYLKIDTEGHDLEVLKGSTAMLSQAAIDLIEVEAGMNRENKWHVPLEDFKTYLEQRGYFVFGVYEQVGEWKTQEPHLRRSNLVFMAKHVIAAN